jgi:hypothetical protein
MSVAPREPSERLGHRAGRYVRRLYARRRIVFEERAHCVDLGGVVEECLAAFGIGDHLQLREDHLPHYHQPLVPPREQGELAEQLVLVHLAGAVRGPHAIDLSITLGPDRCAVVPEVIR